MAVIPSPFGMLLESSIASYNFTEMASNLGYVAFYPYTSSGSFLTTNSTLHSSGAYTNSPATKVFSVKFNKQTLIGGPAKINLLHGDYDNVGDISGLYSISIFKNSILLASGALIATYPTTPGAGALKTTYVCADIEIPETIIGAGDELKLRIAFESNGSGRLGHDPANTSWTDLGLTPAAGPDATRSTFLVPFRINL